MRIRCGHRPEDWTDAGPAHATHPGLRGQLVVGEPGWRDKPRPSRTPEERAAAYLRTKKYRERHGKAA